jgi:hypothetical protein
MGLPVAGQHVWGAFDAGGQRHLVIRHFQNEMAGRLLAYRELSFVRESQSGYSGLCDVGVIGGQWGIHHPRFAFTTNQQGGRWHERGLLDVVVSPRMEALQFAVPDADEPLAYLCRMFVVDGGSVFGVSVDRGVVLHEQVYLRSGHGWALSTYKRRLQGVWTAFVTCFEDGSVHWGQLCWSRDGWGFAIVQRTDGKPILVHRPQCVTSLDSNGVPVSHRFDLDGEVWVWESGGRIRLPGPPDTVPVWSEGIVRRDGDPRAVAFAHTWSEVYPGRL